jgi:hypothetical protein
MQRRPSVSSVTIIAKYSLYGTGTFVRGCEDECEGHEVREHGGLQRTVLLLGPTAPFSILIRIKII